VNKDKVSVWWLAVTLLPLATYVALQFAGPSAMSRWLDPLGADRFSAEIARTVSYGLIGNELASGAASSAGDTVRLVPVRAHVERAP
jgi:hypothetical protein